MTELVVGIFVVVYLGMILGGLPLLQLDRTGVALLGAIALIGFDAVSLEEAAQSIHLPTLILLFSFMVVSAQMRLGGFYDGVTRWLAALPLAPPLLIGALISSWPRCRRCSATTSCASPWRRSSSTPAAAGAWTRCPFCSRWPAPPTSARPRR